MGSSNRSGMSTMGCLERPGAEDDAVPGPRDRHRGWGADRQVVVIGSRFLLARNSYLPIRSKSMES